jgi:hypothetical protein
MYSYQNLFKFGSRVTNSFAPVFKNCIEIYFFRIGFQGALEVQDQYGEQSIQTYRDRTQLPKN